MNKFRKVMVRYEKKTGNYQALVEFACAIIIWRNIIPVHPGLIPGQALSAIPQAAWRGNIEPLGLAKRCDILLPIQRLAGRLITIKPVFIQGNRPGFRTVAVTMVAFPGGYGVVIFIV
jgi:hypothetical protein